MIPCLYSADETKFTTNGLGKLPDCESCKVTEKRNGAYELAMTYPANGIHADEIAADCIVLAKPSEAAEPQPFRIYDVGTDISGNLTIAAEHISYMLNYITMSPVSVVSGTSFQPQYALQAIRSSTPVNCPFNFQTDITSTAYFGILTPVTVRSALGGVDGSMLDTFGGEFEWDFFNVTLHKARGADNGVKITYGKNLSDFRRDTDLSNTITAVHPYWEGDNGLIFELSEKIVSLVDEDCETAYQKIALLDCKSQFEEEPSEAQMRAYAQTYLTDTTTTSPNVDITINFVALWQTEEYTEIAAAEKVSLCDTVHVYLPKFGETIKMKVTETVYDTLLERYDSITLSNSATASRNKELSLTVATTSGAKALIALTDSAIRLSVTKHLENYSTTAQITSMIEVAEDSILLDVSTNYYDKNTTIRSYFAMDSTSVTVSSGVIAFTSNTISIDSDNFTLSTDGTVAATGSFSSGSDSGTKSTLSSGNLTFYYNGAESGVVQASSAVTWTHYDGSVSVYKRLRLESENVDLTANMLDFRADEIVVLPDGTSTFSICQGGTLTVVTAIDMTEQEYVTKIEDNGDGTISWTTSTLQRVETVHSSTIKFTKGLLTTSIGG